MTPLTIEDCSQIQLNIKSKLEKGVQDGNISPADFEVIYNSDPRISSFYTFQKIHKTNNPGQPIVNSIGSITEKISASVDENIKHLSRLVLYYIKDTGHFLNIIKDTHIEEKDPLVTVDVSSPYPNIKHQDGIEALRL